MPHHKLHNIGDSLHKHSSVRLSDASAVSHIVQTEERFGLICSTLMGGDEIGDAGYQGRNLRVPIPATVKVRRFPGARFAPLTGCPSGGDLDLVDSLDR